MALLDDLSVIQAASSRAINLLIQAQKTGVFSNDDSVQDADSAWTPTPAQRQEKLAKLDPLFTVIKNRAGQLP